MKNKFIIILFLIGLIVTSIGSFFKIAHWEIGFFNGSRIIFVGLFIKVLSVIILIKKLVSDKNNSFLNN